MWWVGVGQSQEGVAVAPQHRPSLPWSSSNRAGATAVGAMEAAATVVATAVRLVAGWAAETVAQDSEGPWAEVQ